MEKIFMQIKLWKIFIFLFSVTVVVSCGKKKEQIVIDGSSTVYPIAEAIAEEYRYVNSKINIAVGTSGTGGGFKKFCNGETDISEASRPVRKTEMDFCRGANIDMLELPIAYDGIAVVVNSENTFVSKLTTSELKTIFDADIAAKTWKDVNSAWPSEPIKVFSPGHDSGTYDYFNEVIIGQKKTESGKRIPGQIRQDAFFSEDDNTLVTGITGEKFAIGFFGLAYFTENKEKLKAISIENGKGEFIQPSPEAVRDGSYEPLSRPLFIYVKSFFEQESVEEFITFYLDNVSRIALDVGYVPLPVRLMEAVKDRFTQRVKGSLFLNEKNNGKSLKELYL